MMWIAYIVLGAALLTLIISCGLLAILWDIRDAFDVDLETDDEEVLQ